MGLPQPHENLSTDELFRRFAPFVARFLFRLGVRSDGLDDVVQEVFLVVHRRGGYKAGPAKPTSYLATIATNAASAYRRKQQAQRTRSSDTEVETLVSTNKGPVQVLETTERLQLLQGALDRLEPDLRSTLILADIEGESCASIAASMGVPTGTVYWRLHEARKRFQKALRAEESGIPTRPSAPPAREAAAERRSILALAWNPLWFVSDARRLLRTGALQPPVHYDVLAGLERHRELANTMALPSWAPATVAASAAAPSAGIGIIGVSGLGIAGAAALAVGLLLQSKPNSTDDEHGNAQALASALPAGTTSPAVRTQAVARPDPSAPSGERAALDDVDSHEASMGHALAEAPSTAQASEEAAPTLITAPHALERPVTKPQHDTPAAPSARPSPRPAQTATPVVSNDTETKPTPKPATDETLPAPSDTKVEATEIARAERMLSSNPAGALAVVRNARARFKPSFLPEERDYLEVMALKGLGRSDEAKSAASRFLAAYPGGAFANRVRSAIAK